ncbi:hypothetical protein PVAG01_10185 [Phlyctema vagabunda]|uniref:Uncharacterized protein n=1 Tax=Phlyctema vagabunda TaxID=108571 RepID=A0ABR4P581_9HELO
MTLFSTSRPTLTLTAGTRSHSVNLILGPALTASLYRLHYATYFLSYVVLQQSLYASNYLLVQTIHGARLSLGAAAEALRRAWQRLEPLRKKIFFEFMVFVLGTCGNGLILLLFWPGWLLLAALLLTISWVVG